MQHIRNYYELLSKILRERSEWDLAYWLDSFQNADEVYKEFKIIKAELCEAARKQLDIEMKKKAYQSREDLVNMFWFIIEKQRGYPLWMGELSDIEDWAEDWAEDNWYKFLFTNDD